MIQEIIMYVYKGMVTTLTAYTYPYISHCASMKSYLKHLTKDTCVFV